MSDNGPASVRVGPTRRRHDGPRSVREELAMDSDNIWYEPSPWPAPDPATAVGTHEPADVRQRPKRGRRGARGAAALAGLAALAAGAAGYAVTSHANNGAKVSASAPTTALAPATSPAPATNLPPSTGDTAPSSSAAPSSNATASPSTNAGSQNAGSQSAGSQSAGTQARTSSSLTAGVVDIDTVIDYNAAEAAGTGLVLTASGEILTNNHVI